LSGQGRKKTLVLGNSKKRKRKKYFLGFLENLVGLVGLVGRTGKIPLLSCSLCLSNQIYYIYKKYNGRTNGKEFPFSLVFCVCLTKFSNF
jgi:hypothetical protein